MASCNILTGVNSTECKMFSYYRLQGSFACPPSPRELQWSWCIRNDTLDALDNKRVEFCMRSQEIHRRRWVAFSYRKYELLALAVWMSIFLTKKHWCDWSRSESFPANSNSNHGGKINCESRSNNFSQYSNCVQYAQKNNCISVTVHNHLYSAFWFSWGRYEHPTLNRKHTSQTWQCQMVNTCEHEHSHKQMYLWVAY